MNTDTNTSSRLILLGDSLIEGWSWPFLSVIGWISWSTGWYLATFFVMCIMGGMMLYGIGRTVWLVWDILRMSREARRRLGEL